MKVTDTENIMPEKTNRIQKFTTYVSQHRIILHLTFWMTFTVFYSFIYGSSSAGFLLKFYHTLFLLPVAIAASYFTMLVLIDRFLLTSRYGLFIVLLIASAIFFTFLQVCVYYYFIYPVLYPNEDINQLLQINRFLIELLRLYAIVSLASVLKLLRHWNRIKTINNQLMEKNLRAELLISNAEKQKIAAELEALKSQLNPHFLFNVLNSIYSHSLLKSDMAPAIVLKLSNLMSYILYDCKTDMVSLQKEIEFIKNYIELEKIRLEEDFKVEFDIQNIRQEQIPPLLFVPLIENAFKHGMGSHPDIKCISLSMKIANGSLYFNLRNSKGAIKNSFKKKQTGGIGIENVRKRLELLYPESHTMEITETDDSFEVEVIIHKFD